MSRKMKVILGVVIGVLVIAAGILGYAYNKKIWFFSSAATLQTSTLTKSPLTAAQTTNENTVFQTAFQNAWIDYIKEYGIPEQGDEISLNESNFGFSKYLGVQSAKAAGTRKCSNLESAMLSSYLAGRLGGQVGNTKFGTCEVSRTYSLKGTINISQGKTSKHILRVTFSGTLRGSMVIRDPETCMTRTHSWSRSYSHTFYMNSVTQSIIYNPDTSEVGGWSQYCSSPLETPDIVMVNPKINETCPCKKPGTPTPATPTPKPGTGTPAQTEYRTY